MGFKPAAFILALIAPVAGAGEPAASPAADVKIDLIREHCLACHSSEEASGDVDLEKAIAAGSFLPHARQWNKVVLALRDRRMPPPDEPSPSDSDRNALMDWIDQNVQTAARESPPYSGRVTIRRLNRTEYQNTLRDLFGMPLVVSGDLPADAAGNGFDNQGDTLFIPPVLMEKYLDTTRRVLDTVFADEATKGRILIKPADTASAIEVAKHSLQVFLPRAFRRPIEAADLEPRIRIVEQSLARGESFDDAMKLSLQSILLSPYFLFRVEEDQAPVGNQDAYRIKDHELAVRLSYFLWSTMPDQELFDFAAQGKLHEPTVLRAQVERMLADPRSIALADDFAAQWFGFRDMASHELDIRRFPKFNGVRGAMFEESRRFFDLLFRDNGRLLDILDCDYAIVNEHLAAHYGIPNVKGDAFNRVPLDNRRRGGVLGMGSTLAVTSYPTRTSPVLRGKWVLENLLGAPPPAPPPNTPALTKNDNVKDGMTLRQRFEKHRADPTCASCHAVMDPLGFGLENFDGTGEWRDQDNGLPIDSQANLPDGTVVRGVEGLKDALLARKDLFVRLMVEKMLTYALGRAVDDKDEGAVRTIMARVAAKEHRSHALIHAIVESYAFTHRQNSQL